MKNKYFTLAAIITISILMISIVTEISPRSYAAGEEVHIPVWIKNVAKWWANGEIGDSDFVQGIQYLLTHRIMKIHEVKVGPRSSPEIPSWIKIDAKLWAEGQLRDPVFVQGIQYLVQSGIITLPETHAQNQQTNIIINPIVWLAPQPARVGWQYFDCECFKPLAGDQVFGSRDFIDLFVEGSPWKNAEQHVVVFKVYSNYLRTITDLKLNQMVTYLNNHGIALAIEQGPLEKTPICGQGVESFDGKKSTLNAISRVEKAGGKVRFLALDEPFFFGSLYNGPNACHWSTLKVAENVNTFVQSIKQKYPDVMIGDIEPVTRSSNISQIENWLKIYSAVAGSNFAFFHADTEFDTLPDWPNWPMVDKELEAFVHDHKMQFGMIYHGNGSATSDAEWFADAKKRIVIYEVEAAGRPDNVIFQSWQSHPYYVLPETSPYTLTHLVLSYFKTRTILNITSAQSSDGVQVINGKMTQADGITIPDAHIQFFTRPANGSETFIEPNVLSIGSMDTDKNGFFHFNLTMIKSDTVLQAKYSGDENHWPAYAQIQFIS